MLVMMMSKRSFELVYAPEVQEHLRVIRQKEELERSVLAYTGFGRYWLERGSRFERVGV
jgi:hypothetical protein